MGSLGNGTRSLVILSYKSDPKKVQISKTYLDNSSNTEEHNVANKDTE